LSEELSTGTVASDLGLLDGSAIVSTVERNRTQLGAVLREGEEKRFQSLGRIVGERASEAFAKLAP